jgi:hypothetical protein
MMRFLWSYYHTFLERCVEIFLVDYYGLIGLEEVVLLARELGEGGII